MKEVKKMEQKNNEIAQVTKKDLAFIVFLICAFVIISILLCYYSLRDKINNENKAILDAIEELEPNETIVNTDETNEITYMLKAHNGKIGVFENSTYKYSLDVYLFTLPERDKILLSEGIVASTQEELDLLLEEYY